MPESASQRQPVHVSQPADVTAVSQALGARIRAERVRAGVSVRELARRVEVSHSLVSQIERGQVMPSVGTLWAIATELGLSVADLFSEVDAVQAGARSGDGRARPATATSTSPVQRHETRATITLAGGIRWERLTSSSDSDIDFVYVVYPVGSSSCEEDALIRHGGREFGYVISGRLGVRIGFEEYELRPNDSISFDSVRPHRLWAIGDEPVHAIWMVINRRDDPRSGFDS